MVAAADSQARCPKSRDKPWLTPIDPFVLAELEESGLTLAPRQIGPRFAPRYVGPRGVLPSFDEIRQFVDDSRPDAFERVVDRLLASEHYGERWGRHWLDVVRFAKATVSSVIEFAPTSGRTATMSFGHSTAICHTIVRHRATCRRHARRGRRGSAGCYRVSGGWRQNDVGTVSKSSKNHAARRTRRFCRHDRHNLSRPDRWLRTLPRPQVRSHSDTGTIR